MSRGWRRVTSLLFAGASLALVLLVTRQCGSGPSSTSGPPGAELTWMSGGGGLKGAGRGVREAQAGGPPSLATDTAAASGELHVLLLRSVLDATGEPVAGVALELLSHEVAGRHGVVAAGHSDLNGEWRAQVRMPGAFLVRATPSADARLAGHLSGPHPADTGRLSIRLCPASSLHGRVIERSSKRGVGGMAVALLRRLGASPWESIGVGGSLGPGAEAVQTNSLGEFRFEGVESCRTSWLVAYGGPIGSGSAYREVLPGSDAVELEIDAESGVLVQDERGVGVAGALVWFFAASEGSRPAESVEARSPLAAAITDADGRAHDVSPSSARRMLRVVPPNDRSDLKGAWVRSAAAGLVRVCLAMARPLAVVRIRLEDDQPCIVQRVTADGSSWSWEQGHAEVSFEEGTTLLLRALPSAMSVMPVLIEPPLLPRAGREGRSTAGGWVTLDGTQKDVELSRLRTQPTTRVVIRGDPRWRPTMRMQIGSEAERRRLGVESTGYATIETQEWSDFEGGSWELTVPGLEEDDEWWVSVEDCDGALSVARSMSGEDRLVELLPMAFERCTLRVHAPAGFAARSYTSGFWTTYGREVFAAEEPAAASFGGQWGSVSPSRASGDVCVDLRFSVMHGEEVSGVVVLQGAGGRVAVGRIERGVGTDIDIRCVE